MTTVYSLNEFTLPGFLVSSLLGQNPAVLAVDPLFPPFRRLLEPLVNRAIDKGRARWIIDLCPDQQFLWDYPLRATLQNVFGQTEDWHNAHFGFDGLDDNIPDYAMAYRHITCNHAKPLHFQILLIRAVLETHGLNNVRFIGLDNEAIGLLNAFQKQPEASGIRAMRVPNRLFNAAVLILSQVYALGWILWRTRPVRPTVETFFFIADYYEDYRDFRLYHEIAEGGPVLLVLRHPRRQRIKMYGELRAYRHCSCRDGRFGLKEAFNTAAMVIRDGVRLFRRFGTCSPNLCYRVLMLPFRRAVLRGFFTRFRTKAYWGRDDYNEDHILRRQELHRINGTSYGINHGYYPAYTKAFPQIRYISFDRYYVFGQAVYERCMKGTWARDMEIVPVGSFGAERQDYDRRFAPKPRDIIIYSAVFIGHPKMVEFVRGMATAFPDRTILLQIKKTFFRKESGRKFASDCTRGFSNVEVAKEGFFTLISKARYAFSDPSTMVVEALQFGQLAFCVDLMPEGNNSLFLDYPEICVHDPKDAARRILSIETGESEYPLKKFTDLTDLSGRVFFDVVRKDLGLSSKTNTKEIS